MKHKRLIASFFLVLPAAAITLAISVKGLSGNDVLNESLISTTQSAQKIIQLTDSQAELITTINTVSVDNGNITDWSYDKANKRIIINVGGGVKSPNILVPNFYSKDVVQTDNSSSNVFPTTIAYHDADGYDGKLNREPTHRIINTPEKKTITTYNQASNKLDFINNDWRTPDVLTPKISEYDTLIQKYFLDNNIPSTLAYSDKDGFKGTLTQVKDRHDLDSIIRSGMQYVVPYNAYQIITYWSYTGEVSRTTTSYEQDYSGKVYKDGYSDAYKYNFVVSYSRKTNVVEKSIISSVSSYRQQNYGSAYVTIPTGGQLKDLVAVNGDITGKTVTGSNVKVDFQGGTSVSRYVSDKDSKYISGTSFGHDDGSSHSYSDSDGYSGSLYKTGSQSYLAGYGSKPVYGLVKTGSFHATVVDYISSSDGSDSSSAWPSGYSSTVCTGSGSFDIKNGSGALIGKVYWADYDGYNNGITGYETDYSNPYYSSYGIYSGTVYKGGYVDYWDYQVKLNYYLPLTLTLTGSTHRRTAQLSWSINDTDTDYTYTIYEDGKPVVSNLTTTSYEFTSGATYDNWDNSQDPDYNKHEFKVIASHKTQDAQVESNNLIMAKPCVSVSQTYSGWSNRDEVITSRATDKYETITTMGDSDTGSANGSISNSGNSCTYTKTFTTEGWRDSLDTYADNSNGAETISFIPAFGIDKTNPVIAYTPNNTGWTNQDVNVGINVSDSLSGVKDYSVLMSKDSEPTETLGQISKLSLNSEGVYKFTTTAHDKAINESVSNSTIKIDKTHPEYNSVDITDYKLDHYTLTIRNLHDKYSGVKSVKMTTTSQKNNYSDPYTTTQTTNGGDLSFTIYAYNHSNVSGIYRSHMYMYDNAGNCTEKIMDVCLNNIGTLKVIAVKDIGWKDNGYPIVYSKGNSNFPLGQNQKIKIGYAIQYTLGITVPMGNQEIDYTYLGDDGRELSIKFLDGTPIDSVQSVSLHSNSLYYFNHYVPIKSAITVVDKLNGIKYSGNFITVHAFIKDVYNKDGSKMDFDLYKVDYRHSALEDLNSTIKR